MITMPCGESPKVKATITLNYPIGSTEVTADDVEIAIKVKGYKATPPVPASELDDDLWKSLPSPLTREPFEMEIPEDLWIFAAYEYEKYTAIRDIVPNWGQIYQALKPLGYSEAQIDMGWKRFCQADQRSEFFYPVDAAHECRQQMVDDYIEDSLGSSLTQDAIAIQTAEGTGLEPVLTGEGWDFPKFIDGGGGIGCRVVWSK